MLESIAGVPPAGSGGQAAPAQAKQQSGSAAPASDGKSVGSPSTPSAGDAIVAEKKKAEHWRGKYERDVGALTETVQKLEAKLDGLATGVQLNSPPAAKPQPKTFADLDDGSFEEIVKKGFEEQNPGYITESMREVARRAADKAEKRAVESAKSEIVATMAQQQVFSRISQEFGAEAQNQDSELRAVTDRRIADLNRKDPDWLKKDPERLYDIFARADREVRASERGDLDRLRKQESERLARDEIERSNQVIATKSKDDVAELLARGDKQSRREAYAKRLPWITRPPKR
jgi:hypothetical protein